MCQKGLKSCKQYLSLNSHFYWLLILTWAWTTCITVWLTSYEPAEEEERDEALPNHTVISEVGMAGQDAEYGQHNGDDSCHQQVDGDVGLPGAVTLVNCSCRTKCKLCITSPDLFCINHISFILVVWYAKSCFNKTNTPWVNAQITYLLQTQQKAWQTESPWYTLKEDRWNISIYFNESTHNGSDDINLICAWLLHIAVSHHLLG